MNESSTLYFILAPLAGYLLGAIPFGIIVAGLFGIKDIRKLGSGNIGATNVWRYAGAKAAVWVFIGDIGKGAVAVIIAGYFYKNYMTTQIPMELFIAACGLLAVLGHVFPVYLKFKGGKGVNTGLGVVATLMPIQTAISLGAFIITFVLSRYVSLGSMVASAVLVAVLLTQKFVMHQPVSAIYIGLASCICVLVIFAHRNNILRILSNTENKFKFSSKTSGDRRDV